VRSTDKPTVTLDEARRRMGRTFGVDPNCWLWSPAEIRWLASEYRRGGAEVAEGAKSPLLSYNEARRAAGLPDYRRP
jgi:hypothetical protein